ncbi:MAG: hypothetical protein QF664_13910 [Dehalococcoidia bacterium]|nr:hypothetical protein [Dehalococcoidia bacterium]
MRNLAIIVLATALFVAALGCSTNGESQSASPGGPAAATQPTSTAAATPAAEPEIRLRYPGLALELSPGDFWEFTLPAAQQGV